MADLLVAIVVIIAIDNRCCRNAVIPTDHQPCSPRITGGAGILQGYVVCTVYIGIHLINGSHVVLAVSHRTAALSHIQSKPISQSSCSELCSVLFIGSGSREGIRHISIHDRLGLRLGLRFGFGLGLLGGRKLLHFRNGHIGEGAILQRGEEEHTLITATAVGKTDLGKRSIRNQGIEQGLRCAVGQRNHSRGGKGVAGRTIFLLDIIINHGAGQLNGCHQLVFDHNINGRTIIGHGQLGTLTRKGVDFITNAAVYGIIVAFYDDMEGALHNGSVDTCSTGVFGTVILIELANGHDLVGIRGVFILQQPITYHLFVSANHHIASKGIGRGQRSLYVIRPIVIQALVSIIQSVDIAHRINLFALPIFDRTIALGQSHIEKVEQIGIIKGRAEIKAVHIRSESDTRILNLDRLRRRINRICRRIRGLLGGDNIRLPRLRGSILGLGWCIDGLRGSGRRCFGGYNGISSRFCRSVVAGNQNNCQY